MIKNSVHSASNLHFSTCIVFIVGVLSSMSRKIIPMMNSVVSNATRHPTMIVALSMFIVFLFLFP